MEHVRTIDEEIRALKGLDERELRLVRPSSSIPSPSSHTLCDQAASTHRVPYELVLEVQQAGRLPVVNFAAGGVATPADAALMMQLG